MQNKGEADILTSYIDSFTRNGCFAMACRGLSYDTIIADLTAISSGRIV